MSLKDQVRAALYVRISKDAEEQGLGIQRQLGDCQALAESKGWEVAEVFEDNDISASTSKPRPAYARMTEAIQSGRINAIVVWDVDRLTRTPRELEDVIDWADRQGLSLASVGGEIDLGTPQGRMTARIKGTVARHEVEQMSRRLRRKMQELAETGKYVGPRPYGWDFDSEGNLVINEQEARIVREGYRRILGGESVHAVVKDLTGRGIKTGRGAEWKTVSFRKVLLRWINCSVRMHNGKEVGPGSWPALVSRDEHERITALLTDPSRASRGEGVGSKAKHLLSGLLTCARCGARLYRVNGLEKVQRAKRKDGSVRETLSVIPSLYRCHAQNGCGAVSMSAEKLEDYVSEVALQIMERDGVEILGGDSEALEAARKDIAAVKAKLSLVADQFADDLVTADQFQRLTAKLRAQLEDAERAERAAMPNESASDFTGSQAREAWRRGSVDQRREMIRVLVDAGLSIKVDNPGRKLKGRFNPEAVEFTMLQ